MSKSIAATKSTSTHGKLPLLLLLALSPVLSAGLVGCRTTSDNQIDLLERELRVQEDYIYELEGYVVDYSDKLRDCRGCSPSQTAVYSEEVYQPKTEPRKKSVKKPAPRRVDKERSIIENDKSDLPAPDSEPRKPEISPEDLEVPDIDLELEDPITEVDNARHLQQVGAIDLDYNSANGKVLMIPDPVDFQPTANEQYDDRYSDEPYTNEELSDADDDRYSDELEYEPGDDMYAEDQYADDRHADEDFDENLDEEIDEAMFDDEQVAETAAIVERVPKRLEVTRLFRGEGGDQSPQNLLTVVEALDENNEPVDLDGEVSLMIMTTDNSGAHKRLKRWNFTSAETLSAWQSSDLGDGLHLELPLEKTSLPADPLELWVRLVTTDGRKLLTQLPFETSTLSDLGDDAPQPMPTNSALAAAKPSSINPLRTATQESSSSENLQLADHEPSAGEQRWRSSMHRTDRTSEGFATTSATTSGWTKQSPGRQAYQPAQVASRPVAPSVQSMSQPPAKPTWAAGRSTALPTTSPATTSPASTTSNASSGWSTTR